MHKVAQDEPLPLLEIDGDDREPATWLEEAHTVRALAACPWATSVHIWRFASGLNTAPSFLRSVGFSFPHLARLCISHTIFPNVYSLLSCIAQLPGTLEMLEIYHVDEGQRRPLDPLTLPVAHRPAVRGSLRYLDIMDLPDLAAWYPNIARWMTETGPWTISTLANWCFAFGEDVQAHNNFLRMLSKSLKSFTLYAEPQSLENCDREWLCIILRNYI